jgi:hypothetical protein
MHTLKIGDVTITSIIERDGPWRPPEDMFPAYDPEIGKRQHAQRRIHSNDHHQVVGMSLSPCPARGPENTQCVYAKCESQADDDQRYAKKKQTISVRHFCISHVWFIDFPPSVVTSRPCEHNRNLRTDRKDRPGKDGR